ncbi:PK beta-barrel-protein domain-containing protein-like protein [Aspergillus karnatakaensis]|uniref:MOSC domain-containing protein n=1 Tax=Aspergillus karnatakaensis TaxID=1810916 RepID=UPI003CCD50D3
MATEKLPKPLVLSVTTSSTHDFSKPAVDSITLVEGLGIQGDAHFGETVQHRSRLHIKPPPANLRQVHLIPIEILDKISLSISADEKIQLFEPGAIGQNITTEGIDLLALGAGTELRFFNPDNTNQNDKSEAIIVITGLRNPCPQIDKFQPGLKERFLVRDAERQIVGRLAGVMATVKRGGVITAGMGIAVTRPAEHLPLGPV